MDNTPDEQINQQSGQSSGEIFSSEEKSAYEEAIAPEEVQTQTQSQQPGVTADVASYVSPPDETGIAQLQGEGPPAGGDKEGQPPPFITEDKRKKYILFAILAIIILVAVGLLVSFIFRSRSKNSKKETPQDITLTYWGLWESEEVMKPIIDQYQASHSNITINYTNWDPKQYRERLQAAIERGEGPDIFRFHNTWVPMLIKDLSIIPDNIYSLSEFENTFYPVAVNDLTSKGKIYGIPLEIDGLLLFYNQDILKSANVGVPKTWIDVQDAVPKLTVKEGGRIVTSAIALGTAENIEHFSDILGLMMLQNGVKLDQSLFSCVDAASSGCAIEVIDFYRRFAETPHSTWDETLDNSILAFAKGKVAMIFAPSWQVFTIRAINPDLNFRLVAVPQLPCGTDSCPTVNWASYWVEGVSAKSVNQQSAWEFLKFLSTKDTMQKLYNLQMEQRQLFGEPYSRVDLANILADNQYLAPLISQAPTMKSFYLTSRTHDGETGIDTSLVNYLKDAINSLTQGVSSETALKTADQGFKEVLSRFGILTTPVP